MESDLKRGRLTVVLPNYNHGAFIRETLASVLAQTRIPDRVLVLDDRSEDDSREIVRQFAAAHPAIELLENPERLGVNGNLNRGLGLVDTEFVTLLAADDLVAPRLYATALELLAEHPQAAFCATAQQWIDAAGAKMRQPGEPPIAEGPIYLPATRAFDLLNRYGSYLAGTGCVYRTAKLRAHGLFWSEAGPWSDTFGQLVLAAEGGLCYIPQRYASWRRLSGGYALSKGRDPAAGLKVLRFVAERLQVPPADRIPKPYQRRMLRRLAFETVRSALLAQPPDFEVAKAAFVGAGGIDLLRLAHAVAGARLSVPLAMALLRSGDIPFALRRRLRPAVRG